MATKKETDPQITVTQISPEPDKNPRFLARHEGRAVQFTGESKKDAMEKLNVFLAAQD